MQSAKDTISFCIDNDDNIIIAFHYKYVIQKYSPDEKLLFEVIRPLPYVPKPLKVVFPTATSKRIEGDKIIQGVQVDKNDNIYVMWGGKANEQGLVIDIFNPNGKFIGSFRSGVTPNYDFQKFFIDENDSLYVLEPLQEPKLYRYHMVRYYLD